jgi:hypothetical protein
MNIHISLRKLNDQNTYRITHIQYIIFIISFSNFNFFLLHSFSMFSREVHICFLYIFVLWNKGTWPISVVNLHSTFISCLYVSDDKLGVFLCFVSASLSLNYLFISIYYPPYHRRVSFTFTSRFFSPQNFFVFLSPTVFRSITSTSCYLHPISLKLSCFCLTASLLCPYLSR